MDEALAWLIVIVGSVLFLRWAYNILPRWLLVAVVVLFVIERLPLAVVDQVVNASNVLGPAIVNVLEPLLKLALVLLGLMVMIYKGFGGGTKR